MVEPKRKRKADKQKDGSRNQHRRDRRKKEDDEACKEGELHISSFGDQETSVSALIGVPIEFIFRTVSQGNSAVGFSQSSSSHKPLLSRQEAQAFMSIGLLAHEMDSLVHLSEKELGKRHLHGAFAVRLESVKNPYLLPLLPLLHVMSEHIPGVALQNIQKELDEVVSEMRAISTTMRQYSEQNWELSDGLMDACESFAIEKRRLSDIQEEVCNRIDKLVGQTEAQMETLHDDSEDDEGEFVSMNDFCERVFNAVVDPEAEAERTRQSPSDEAGKENTPSQQRHSGVLQTLPNGSQSGSASGGVWGEQSQNAAEILSLLSATT